VDADHIRKARVVRPVAAAVRGKPVYLPLLETANHDQVHVPAAALPDIPQHMVYLRLIQVRPRRKPIVPNTINLRRQMLHYPAHRPPHRAAALRIARDLTAVDNRILKVTYHLTKP